jgi:hypothetical protein
MQALAHHPQQLAPLTQKLLLSKPVLHRVRHVSAAAKNNDDIDAILSKYNSELQQPLERSNQQLA